MNEKRQSERLILQPLGPEQLEALLQENQTFLPDSVLTAVMTLAIRQKMTLMKEAPPEAWPWLTYWRIMKQDSGRGIGLIGSKNLPDADGYVEIGYALAREYRGYGYMTEALDAFLDWLYEFAFCTGAVLRIHASNAPSLRVAEYCGFRYEETADLYRVYRYVF